MNTLIDVLAENDPKFTLLSKDKERAARKKVSKVLQVVFDLVGVFLHNFQLTERELKSNGQYTYGMAPALAGPMRLI